MTDLKLLSAFHKHLWPTGLPFADFEPVRNPDEAVQALFKKPIPPGALTVIGQRRDGSLAALWRYDAAKQQAVVWISSDGMPNGVVATSLDDFLSFLAYSTYLIVDVLWTALQHWRRPDYYPSVAQSSLIGTEQSYLKSNRSRGAGYAAYIRWLKQFGLEQAANPVEKLTAAFAHCPSFSEWYQKFN